MAKRFGKLKKKNTGTTDALRDLRAKEFERSLRQVIKDTINKDKFGKDPGYDSKLPA